MEISKFDGEYAFLSNFYECNICHEGIVYPTVEHAFQAVKTMDLDERRKIASLPTPGQAKRAGRKVALRPDWETIKRDVMKQFVTLKFSNKELAEKLLATGDAVLIEGNTWNDTYWGVCRGVGKNNLGQILMEVRETLKK